MLEDKRECKGQADEEAGCLLYCCWRTGRQVFAEGDLEETL